jgi:hypothetical protein
VYPVSPDASGHAVFYADSLGIAYDQLVMVVMATDPSLDTTDLANYSYQAATFDGIADHTRQTQLRIYPNPAQDQLFLEWPDGKNDKGVMEIYDTAGNRIMTSNINRKTKSINIQDLHAGAYSVMIRLGETVVTARFVKQ